MGNREPSFNLLYSGTKHYHCLIVKETGCGAHQPSKLPLLGASGNLSYVLPRVANDHLAQITYLQILQNQVYRTSQQLYDNQLTHTDHKFKS